MIEEIKNYYDQNKFSEIDHDFLDYEELMMTEEDQRYILDLLNFRESKRAGSRQPLFDENPHNSIILYLVDLTTEFDTNRQRSDTIGGSPPDRLCRPDK